MTGPAPSRPEELAGRRAVHPVVERLAAYSWRLLAIAAAGVATLWLLGRLWVVCAALIIALMLARVLSPPATWLQSRGWPAGVAAATTLLLFLPLFAAPVVLVGVGVAGETDTFGRTVSQAVDDVESWLLNDAPFDISRHDLEGFRRDAGQAINDTLRSSSGKLVSGAVVVVELMISAIAGLILTFFLLKDGDRL